MESMSMVAGLRCGLKPVDVEVKGPRESGNHDIASFHRELESLTAQTEHNLQFIHCFQD